MKKIRLNHRLLHIRFYLGCLTLLAMFFTASPFSAQATGCVKGEFDFTVDNYTVTFKARTAGPVLLTYWYADNQLIGKGDHLKYTFTAKGEYKVCLLVLGFDSLTNQRCEFRYCEVVYIKDSCDLRAKFGYTVDGNKVLFEAGSNSTSVKYYWRFSDQNTGSEGRIIRREFKYGTYKVCLVAKDTITGCVAEYCDVITIDSCDLRIDFAYNSDSLKTIFEAKSNSNNTIYGWNFGDGTAARGRVQRHIYLKAGRYEVCLTALDTVTNCKTRICKIVEVDDGCDLEAKFGYRIDSNIIVLEAGANSRNVVYRWSLGDGHDGSGRIIKHRYAKPGKYEICLYAKDTVTNCHVKLCRTVLVDFDHCNLIADFHFRIDGNLVVFEGKANEDSVRFIWNFGDDHLGSGHLVKHLYRNGTYKVCLTVIDSDGRCRTTVCKEIVIDHCELKGDFTIRQDNNRFVFAARSNDDHAIYLWDFGDGSIAVGNKTRHKYLKAGTYNVCLTIISRANKCRIKVCKRVDVKDRCDVEVDFHFTGTNAEFKFEAKSNKRVVFIWSFGDGHRGKGRYVSHRFGAEGTYRVCVTAIDLKTGCRATECKLVTVKKPCELEAKFRYEISHTGEVKFLGVTNEDSVHAIWDFGDGNKARGLRTAHQYKMSGVYRVCLVVESKDGCRVKVCQEIVVKIGTRLVADPDIDIPDPDDVKTEADTKVETKTRLELNWNIQLSPNPVTASAKVTVNGAAGARVEVMNMLGTIVRSETMSGSETELDLGNLQRGYYYIRVISETNDVKQIKFLKQ